MIRAAIPVVWGLATCVGVASAQVSAFAGGGATLPVGMFGDVAGVGPTGFAGAALQVGGFAVGLEGSYARNGHDNGGARSQLVGAQALVSRRLVTVGRVSVAATGGIGGVRHSVRSERFPGLDAVRSGVTFEGRLVASTDVGNVRPFVAASYSRGAGSLNSTFPTEFVALRAGAAVRLAS